MPRITNDQTSRFGTWIDELVENLGTNLEGLAIRGNVGQSTLSMWRNGSRQPSREAVVNFAASLGIPATKGLRAAGYLSEDDQEFLDLDDDQKYLLAMYDNATPEGREGLINALKAMKRIEPGHMQPGEMDEMPDD